MEQYSFRNPPHFLSLTDYEARDAYFETENVCQTSCGVRVLEVAQSLSVEMNE